MSPYLSRAFLEQLTDFSNRLHGNIELDKSSTWIGGKISKPSLDSIGGWLGGTLTKFVAGDVEPASPLSREGSIAENPAYTGAFQNYSSISSANASKSPSPAPSLNGNGNGMYGPGSVATLKTLYNSQNPISRAASAVDHIRPSSRKNTPPPRVASASAATTTFAQSRSYSHSNLDNVNETANGYDNRASSESNGWWGAAYGDSGGPTPTATSFVQVNGARSTDADGFISPLDTYQSQSQSVTPSPSNAHRYEEDLDDDLGLGNSSHKSKRTEKQESDSNADDRSSEDPKESKKESDVPKKPGN